MQVPARYIDRSRHNRPPPRSGSRVFLGHVLPSLPAFRYRWRQSLIPYTLFQLLGHFRVFLQIFHGVVLALTNLIALVAVPGTGFINQAHLDTVVNDFPEAINSRAVQNLKDRKSTRLNSSHVAISYAV